MQDNATTIRASAKRMAWFGAKISLFVLGPICILLWAALIVGIIYKSASAGISPLVFLNTVVPDMPGSPTVRVIIARMMLLTLAGVIYGMCICGLAGAAIGAVAAAISRRLRKTR